MVGDDGARERPGGLVAPRVRAHDEELHGRRGGRGVRQQDGHGGALCKVGTVKLDVGIIRRFYADERTDEHERTGSDTDLPLKRDRLLTSYNMNTGLNAGQCAPFDIDDETDFPADDYIEAYTEACRRANALGARVIRY